MPKVLIMDPASGSRSTWHEIFGDSEDALNGNISRVFLTDVPMSVPTTDCRQPDGWSCGPYSMAECLGMANGEEARNWLIQRGWITSDSGTWYEGIVGYINAKGYGCDYDGYAYDGRMSGEIFDRIISHLQSGRKIILCMHGTKKGCRTNYWTKSGHYICVYGIDTVPDDSYTFTLNQVKVGDVNSHVRLLQKILKSRGLYKGKIDKSYGHKTELAVIEYQKFIDDHGGNLVVDGVCGPSTWSSLLGISGTASGSKATFMVRQVKVGDTNSVYVLLAQEILKVDGYYDGSLDWSFGPATEKAVRAAQQKFGINVDGVCGPTTFKKLLRL